MQYKKVQKLTCNEPYSSSSFLVIIIIIIMKAWRDLLGVQYAVSENCKCELLDYYTPDMVGIQVDCEVLGELIKSVVFVLYITCCRHSSMQNFS